MMKLLPLYLFLAVLTLSTMTSCTTLANRRDLYFPQPTEGPYTTMMKSGKR
jgi:hypothetical protein